MMVLEVLIHDFRSGLPKEILYVDDLVLTAESLKEMRNLSSGKIPMEPSGIKSEPK